MFRNGTAEADGADGGASCRALVPVVASTPKVSARPRPLSAFLAQLATSDGPQTSRALRAPGAARLYAEAAALTDA